MDAALYRRQNALDDPCLATADQFRLPTVSGLMTTPHKYHWNKFSFLDNKSQVGRYITIRHKNEYIDRFINHFNSSL